MSSLPLKHTTVQHGLIQASLLRSAMDDEELALRFMITLELVPQQDDPSPRIVVSPFALPMQTWSDLANRQFDLPIHPPVRFHEGQSMPNHGHGAALLSIAGTERTLCCTQIAFGAINNGHIQATLTLAEAQTPKHLLPVAVELTAPLEIGYIYVADYGQRSPMGVGEAKKIAAPFLNLNDFKIGRKGKSVVFLFKGLAQ